MASAAPRRPDVRSGGAEGLSIAQGRTGENEGHAWAAPTYRAQDAVDAAGGDSGCAGRVDGALLAKAAGLVLRVHLGVPLLLRRIALGPWLFSRHRLPTSGLRAPARGKRQGREAPASANPSRIGLPRPWRGDARGRLTSSHYFSGAGWWRLLGMSWSRAMGGIPFEFLRNRGRAAPCFLVQQRHTRTLTS